MTDKKINGRLVRRQWRFGLLAGVCLVFPAVAMAAEPLPPGETGDMSEAVSGEPQAAVNDGARDGAIIYTAADFSRFAPRSALDMLLQVPGFTIDDPSAGGNGGGGGNNDNEARGLGQASGNVLLNGERFTSKSDSITNQLARIGADDVVRIELVDGATLDLPGLSGRIANIVARRSSGVSGQFEWKGQVRGRYAESTLKGFSGSITGSSGPLSYVLAFDNDPFHGGAEGTNIITYADGRVENRSNGIRPQRRRPKFSGSARLDGSSGWVANINGSYRWELFQVTEPELWQPFPGSSATASEIVQVNSPEEAYEVGADFAFDLGPGRLTLIGLMSRLDDEFAQQGRIDRADGTPVTGSRFVRNSIESEKIIRAEYGWHMLGGDWQLSGEGAYNRLNNVARLFSLSVDGEFVEVPFPAGTGGVIEDRYEMLLFHGRPLSDNLTFQITAGGEYSTISQTGANALARNFLRPKGSIGLAWAPQSGLDISFSLSREVGQLNFEDFLAEVNIGDANTNAGNNELRPEQKWAAELEIAKEFGAWGSGTLTLFENRITDYLTIVPLAGGGESTGNIDSASEHGVRLSGTLRLDPLGIPGAKFDIEATYQQSNLVDPVTGASRSFDSYEPSEVDVEYRHDLPGSSWAWGSQYKLTRFDPYFRVAEVGRKYNRSNRLRVFVEHKNIFGLTGLLSMENVLRSDVVLDRVVTDGPRNTSPFLFSEKRLREVGRFYKFSLKGNF